jgi:DhnA family fructose-bisphosphate aldolase class Ia
LESIEQRVQKLKVGKFFPLLALDHGLTYGIEQSVELAMVKSLLKTCKGQIGGVVLTFGLAKHLALDENDVPVVLQCFGGPLESEKVQVASIDQALRLRATAVSLQLTLTTGRPPASALTREIGKFVASAYEYHLPVLFMVGLDDPRNLRAVANALRISQEMGADFIKVRAVVTEAETSGNVETLATTVKQAPPVLLAGGVVGSDLMAEAGVAARRLLFRGYCIGRNIFQARDPLSVVSGLNRIWDTARDTKP